MTVKALTQKQSSLRYWEDLSKYMYSKSVKGHTTPDRHRCRCLQCKLHLPSTPLFQKRLLFKIKQTQGQLLTAITLKRRKGIVYGVYFIVGQRKHHLSPKILAVKNAYPSETTFLGFFQNIWRQSSCIRDSLSFAFKKLTQVRH